MDDEELMDEEQEARELEQRHRDTAQMSQILELVSPFNRQSAVGGGRQEGIELGGLREELERIKQSQDAVIQQLEQASSLNTQQCSGIPLALTNIVGTWKTVASNTPLVPRDSYPPAFLYGFMWYKLDGNHLHCCFFNGTDHEKTVDAIGEESIGETASSRKMTFVEGNRVITSHRRVLDGVEFMRIERVVEPERLEFVFRKEDLICHRVYERVFKR